MTHHAASSPFCSSPSPAPRPGGSPLAPSGAGKAQVTLRTAAELVDALPYLMGFHPDESIVILALHGPGGRFGGRLRFDIPEPSDDWPATAAELSGYLLRASEHRSGKPDGAVVFLCSDPRPGEEGRAVMERLRPLAQHLRTACGELDVPVHEALCVSGGRWWSYTCPGEDSCPVEGAPVDHTGTSVMAAAAAFAGIRVRGLRGLGARFDPLTGAAAGAQERALDEAAADLVGRILDRGQAGQVRERTAALLETVLERFRRTPPAVDGTGRGRRQPAAGECAAEALRDAEADRQDDGLLEDGEAARILLGLQDKETRDRAAEWMEASDAAPALRLWRALARRCVGAFRGHAAPPLALAGWVAWSSGDEAEARVALNRALTAEPEYAFARLLHAACNQGIDPEPLRACLREERLARRGGR